MWAAPRACILCLRLFFLGIMNTITGSGQDVLLGRCSGQNIRKLVKDGYVIKKPTVIHSRSRALRNAEAKAKGRHSGYGEKSMLVLGTSLLCTVLCAFKDMLQDAGEQPYKLCLMHTELGAAVQAVHHVSSRQRVMLTSQVPALSLGFPQLH